MKIAIKVLLVEENLIYTKFVTSMLKKQGLPGYDQEFEIRAVDNLAVGLEMLAHKQFDLIITNLGSRKDNEKFEMIKKINREAPNLPVIILCKSHSEIISMQSAVESLENLDYLVKGEFNEAILKQTIRNVFKNKLSLLKYRTREESQFELFKINANPMWIYDIETLRFLAVNKAAIKHYGYTEEEFLSMSIKDIRPTEDIPVLIDHLKKQNPGLDAGGIWQHLKKDGTIIFAEITSQAFIHKNRNAKMIFVRDRSDYVNQTEQLKLLQSALEASANTIIITDNNGKIEWVNQAFTKLTGYISEEVLGNNPNVLKSGLQDDEFYKNLWQTILDGRVWKGEFANRRKDGTVYFEESTITPVKDDENQITHFIAVKQDITERKQAEEKLLASEDRYRSFFEADLTGDFISTPSGKILACNEAFAKIFGFDSVDEVLDNNASELYGSISDRSEFLQLLKEKKMLKDIRFKMRRRDGKMIYILENVVGEFDDNGELIQFKGFIIDETERVQAEEIISQSEERYRTIVNTSSDVIAQISTQGIITSLNPSFERITGWSSDEWIGKNFLELVYFDDVQSTSDYLTNAFNGESLQLFNLRLRTKSGIFINFEINVTPQILNGQVIGLLASARDTTTREKLEEQVRQVQKMESLGALAGGIAHDFNNLLSIILGHTSIIEKNVSDPARLNASVDAITNAVKRGTGLLRQLLMFSRKSEVHFETVQLNDVLNEFLKMLLGTFPKIISMNVDLNKKLPLVKADVNQLHQIFLNLCVNARDAMPKGGTLSVRTEVVDTAIVRKKFRDAKDAPYICVSVTDTGSGMSEATMQKIFEPFFTTKEKDKGTGLGLAVVYGSVKSHNGYIDVESTVGEGTTFYVYIPALSNGEKVTPVIQDEKTNIAGGNETILVVEDEEMILDIVTNILESKGYKVMTARDGYEALQVYIEKKNEIALVISDLGLPKLNGADLLKKLKEINPLIKVIIASGHIETDAQSEMQKYGNVNFMQKPYTVWKVLNQVRTLIDLR
ncbi:MAG: PAS domain S-box protein [Bacteroidota bacterium]|nr:PAS domain S-box protein [Bacteroidota bacterium]